MMKERPLKRAEEHRKERLKEEAEKRKEALEKAKDALEDDDGALNRVASSSSRWQFLRGSNTRKRMNPSAASAVPLLKAKALTREFDEGQVKALRGVDFSINEGEFVAIAGPSGCGKSTLLQLLGALDRPTSGELLYRGESVPDNPDPAAYRASEIGFIFQAFHLLPTFTALENVQLPMFESYRSHSERREHARELLRLVGLEDRLDHFPSKLSGGERQRVAIARSLANGPSLLLADEPTGNLDSDNAHAVLDLIISLQQEQGRTMVLVTHDASIAERAGRILHMMDGRIISDQSVRTENIAANRA